MNKILTENEIKKFKEDGAVFLENKFDINWINKLKTGIEKDIANPSPRFKSHTTKKNVPAYLEDYWTWHLIPEFKEFVYLFITILVISIWMEQCVFCGFHFNQQKKMRELFGLGAHIYGINFF